MKANEIRKGIYFNLINRSGEIHIPIEHALKVAYFGLFDKVIFCEPNENICQIEHPRECHFYDMSPIELTEEWLINKFGFEKHFGNHNRLLYSLPDLTLGRYENDNDYNGYWLKYYQSPHFKKIKYVHTLQNLYLDFTGNELEIK